MNRRELITLLAGAGITLPARTEAQQVQNVPIVGFLHPGSPESGSPVFDALRDGLRDVGYVEGNNIKLEVRWARGKPEILPQLAKELVQLRVNLLVATARPSIEAAIAATTELPIVANDLESDPIASGYVANLARPGGNLTGLFLDSPTLCSKWLQQIHEILPHVTKVGVLWDVTTGRYQLDAISAAAKTISMDVVVMEFRDSGGLEAALDLGMKEGPQAVVQLGSPLIRQGASRVAQILSSRHIPGISQFRTFPDSGGLMSYGPDLIHLYRRIGSYVFKILHGARPSDLPIERPTKFELVINLKAAKALGVTIPGSLLATADEVIEP
jgi:putative tryptophan/tyrosine transport system substrate-binding protein